MTAGAVGAAPALIVLGARAVPLARRIRRALPGAAIHGLAGRIEAKTVDVSFADLPAHLRALFREGRPIVGLCAAGILVRALAPLLRDKRREPPVVALAEDGSFAVPILGGHRGANALARRIARAAGGRAAVTTASDIRLGLALDELPPGWKLGAGPAKRVMAALLEGSKVSLDVDRDLDKRIAGWLAPLRFAGRAALGVRVTPRRRGGRAVLLHPPVLAVGVGCERGADPAELLRLVQRTLSEAGLAAQSVAALVSIDLKTDEPAVLEAAARLGVPARFFPAAALARLAPRLANPSEIVRRATGSPGVAEAAALAATGRGGALIVTKRKSRRCTCAIALSPRPIDAARLGRARGRLVIVGIGPGGAAWRTPEASAALAEAEDVVGYRLYLDLLGAAIAGKRTHRAPLGAEEARTRRALDLAARGRRVALVSSGDPGIYALAALAFELIERENDARWNRIELSVVPGITAMQLAAARAGAPLGHDFCAVSLSDLLTPWPVIERRLRAAAEGDFAVALYNPRSRRRRAQLGKALGILRAARGAAPVVIARNLGRADETVRFATLGSLDERKVDMLTVLLVGAKGTRCVARGRLRFVYTPRGYARGGRR